jgi:flagellar hook-associated protein 3 FlgL
MRTSTLGSHYSLVNQMLRQQTNVAKTQMQVSTQKRILTPSDDPVAAGRILSLENQLSAYAQYERNTNSVQTRLSIEEQALADAGTVLQKIRDLTLQANSGALGADSRNAIATELQERIKELQGIANRKDAGGEYLFSGTSVGTMPFNRAGNAMVYAGDQSSREVQISPTQKILTGHNGYDVFMNIPEGNGTFTVSNGANSGTGWIAPLSVVDPTAWDEGTYTVTFTDATTYEIFDANNVSVASGTYSSGNTIDFRGIRFAITGEPEATDTFVIEPAGTQDIFSTLDQLVATLRASIETGPTQARFNTDITVALAQVDQALDHFLNVRSEVGARLNVIDNVTAARQDLELQLETAVSNLRDVDPIEAVSRLALQRTALEAAQKSFAQFSRLSLFDYL